MLCKRDAILTGVLTSHFLSLSLRVPSLSSVKSINKRQFMWRLRAQTLQADFLGLNHEYEVGQIAHAPWASISSFVKWERYHHLHFTIPWTDLLYTPNAQRMSKVAIDLFCFLVCFFFPPNVTTGGHGILVPRHKKKKKAYDERS